MSDSCESSDESDEYYDSSDEEDRDPRAESTPAPAKDDALSKLGREALARNLERHPIPPLLAAWRRPDPYRTLSTQTAVEAQILTVETYTLEPGDWSSVPQSTKAELVEQMGRSRAELLFGDPRPVIRVVGTTLRSCSVTIHLHGFEPYFAVLLPSTLPGEVNTLRLKNLLNSTAPRKPVSTWSGGSQKRKAEGAPDWIVTEISTFRAASIYYYQFGKKCTFLKVHTRLPEHVGRLRRWFEDSEGVSLPIMGSQAAYSVEACQTFESNVPYELRWMADVDAVGCGWLRAPFSSHWTSSVVELLERASGDAKSPAKMRTQLNIHLDAAAVVVLPSNTENLAPVRGLSFDIECAGRSGVFPDPTYDPVIQIGNYLFESTKPLDSIPRNKIIFALRRVAPIPGADVLSFDAEEDMLLAWQHYLLTTDPDELLSYNGNNFDFVYLLDRAAALGIPAFASLGRDPSRRTMHKLEVSASKQKGSQESHKINLEGRISIDMMQIIRRDHKLSSYSLNSVAAKFLNDRKVDLAHQMIRPMWDGDEHTRQEIAIYCLKDCKLPMDLYNALMKYPNDAEMCRVTGVTKHMLMYRGQSLMARQQILRKANRHGLRLPANKGGAVEGDKYQGATVIEPIKGFHENPIATLDFASLYPSIMMAHNLCYSTLVRNADRPKLNDDDVSTGPMTGHSFVKSSTAQGILPMILQELLGARKKAKDDMKREKAKGKDMDKLKYAVYDGRQLALKISANSVYGFTGAQVGQLPCLEISSTVTDFGRDGLERTTKYVETHYTIQNGYPGNAKVIYGDTDSVMVDFGTKSLAEALELGKKAAAEVSAAEFVKPIKLEFEKCYFPYLLMNKKRYAGLLWTNTKKYDYMDCKGLETVRRDNCQLVKDIVTNSLHGILHAGVELALDRCKRMIRDLCMGNIDLSKLIITKAITKTAEQYAPGTKLVQVELAKKLQKRNPGNAPKVGDRVPYVMIKMFRVDDGKSRTGAKPKAYQIAEDPEYVMEHELAIDYQWYLEHQLKEPLGRIWVAVIAERGVVDLLHGDHTRGIHIAAPINGMGAFVTRVPGCVSCKVPLPPERHSMALCEACDGDPDRRRSAYMTTLSAHVRNERSWHAHWVNCTRCVAQPPTSIPASRDILCTNNECPYYYSRMRAQKDLAKTSAQMARFNGDIEELAR